MSEVVIEWHNVDCNALKHLGAKHKWCIPFSALDRLPMDLKNTLLNTLSKLEIIEDCWEYVCVDKDHVKCVDHGKYICAELNRELRPLIMSLIKAI